MKHVKFWIRVICFCLVLGICLEQYFVFITPEFYTDTWPATATYDCFYSLKNNTVDVLYLGSSHGLTAFLPQELYNNYGITSYNLCCEQQNLVTSYYWLKEALKYQSPKVVVLDAYICFPYKTFDPLNSPETYTRKAFDAMKWSKNKVEAVKTICEIAKNQNKMSYYFPNIRYHDRWEEIGVNDYIYDDMMQYAQLMGAWILDYSSRNSVPEGFEGYEIADSTMESDMEPLMKEYLERIMTLCADSNINFCITMNPTTRRTAEQCKYLEDYSAEKGITCVDFNNRIVFEKIGYNFWNDNADRDHPNIWGAIKITNYLGEIFKSEFGLSPHTDDQWESTKIFYGEKYKECKLKKINDIDEYLDSVNLSYLTVIISAKDEATRCLRDSTKEKLKKMGVSVDLSGHYRSSFVLIIDKQRNIYEALRNESIENETYIQNGFSNVYVKSAGYECGNESSIMIDGQEYSKNSRGLNIVVYSNEKRSVIDSVCFDTFEKENAIIR